MRDFPTRNRSTDTEATDDESEASPIYDGRDDDQEAYWQLVETERFLTKLCVAEDVATNDDGGVWFKDAEGESPLADDGLFYYRNKKELGEQLKTERQNGDRPADQNLPNYKDQFGTPEWEHDELTADNCEEIGLDPDTFDDDEVIHLPAAYEPETDDDGHLLVWYETDNQSECSKDDVLAALNDTEGIGDKTAGKALNSLIDARIVDC